MNCAECTTSNEKTLYDKTLARRFSTASRRSKRAAASMAALGVLVGGTSVLLPQAVAAPDYAGFTTHAQATPLRIELHEPAIPVPSDPQVELNFSYTKVDGASGPIGSARGSALWPGDAVGEGLKTFGQQLGLPGALTDGGYPVQINAQTPGDTASQTQEFFPGNTGKVITTDKQATAKVGYGTSGDVAEGDTGDGADGTKPAPNLLDLLKDPTSLTNLLTGTKSGAPGAPTPSGSPLGGLSALVNVGGMDSISTTNYDPDADAVTAKATARLGRVALLAGLIQLDGVEVVTKTVSNVGGGAKTSQSVNIGSMSIAGQKFGFSGTSIVAQGKATPIPGLPDAPAAALKALGVSFELGKVVTTKNGAAGSVSAEGLRITVDTQPLLSKLPKLPLADLVSKLPDLPGQAAILKGLIVALGDAHPRLDLVLGQATASAQTVPPIDSGTAEPPTTTPPGTTPPTTGTGTAPVATGEIPPADTGALPPSTGVGEVPNAPIQNVGSGLPKLGTVPAGLVIGGLLLALGLGWYVRAAGLTLFGGGAACAHGLKTGIPDLRKV